jgi:hypothetical protein
MENIIEIDGKRYKVTLVEPELTGLPDKWYTDGTAEANEWAKGRFNAFENVTGKAFVGNADEYVGHTREGWDEAGHVYITPAQFNEWVYKPWKESLKPKAPTTIEGVWGYVRPQVYIGTTGEIYNGADWFDINHTPSQAHAKSVLALMQLYNVAIASNKSFERDCPEGYYWYVAKDGKVYQGQEGYQDTSVVRHTSKLSAQHAAEYFWHLFSDFYMLEGER